MLLLHCKINTDGTTNLIGKQKKKLGTVLYIIMHTNITVFYSKKLKKE